MCPRYFLIFFRNTASANRLALKKIYPKQRLGHQNRSVPNGPDCLCSSYVFLQVLVAQERMSWIEKDKAKANVLWWVWDSEGSDIDKIENIFLFCPVAWNYGKWSQATLVDLLQPIGGKKWPRKSSACQTYSGVVGTMGVMGLCNCGKVGFFPID